MLGSSPRTRRDGQWARDSSVGGELTTWFSGDRRRFDEARVSSEPNQVAISCGAMEATTPITGDMAAWPLAHGGHVFERRRTAVARGVGGKWAAERV